MHTLACDAFHSQTKLPLRTVAESGVLAFVCAAVMTTSTLTMTIKPASATATPAAAEQIGTASWYGPRFHGRMTANGERFNQYKLTAAHRTLPLGTIADVVNMENGKTVRVRINDRGPYVGERVIDLSLAAARRLDMIEQGLAKVRV
jgi:rare lipoprotein A